MLNQSKQISEEKLKKKLTPEQYHILRENGTEAPYTSALLNVHEPGMFACAVCGSQLFASDAKFNSGTGWPSFDQALPGAVILQDDDSHGMHRTEVVCATCGSHLGHIFDDGPAFVDPSTGSGSPAATPSSRPATGKRYCINGACLVHKPADSQ